MARPTKNNCDYFPHLTTMRNHKKVKALRNKFGQILGYAFWSMLLEYLTEQDGCELENSEIELEMFAGELGVSVTEIRSMIDYCIKIEILFLNEVNFIYSESLNENLLPVFEKRKKSKEVSKTRKRRENGTFYDKSSTALGVSVAEIPQSKVKYSKVNNKENKEIEFYPFNEFWNDYDKKREKPKCEKKWNTISENDRIKVKEYLPKYKNSTPDQQYRKDPYRFLHNECWNDEIISKQKPELELDPRFKIL